MKYQLSSNPDTIILVDDAVATTIPRGHRLWADYEAWLGEGNQPLPIPDPVQSLPAQVTRYQARAALYKAGLLDDVEGFMVLPDTDRLLVLAWQDAQTFRRNSPIVSDLGAVLGLSAAQIDELFIAAAAID